MPSDTIVSNIDAEIERLQEAKRTLSPTRSTPSKNGKMSAVQRTALLNRRLQTTVDLPRLFDAPDGPGGSVSDGVAVTAYGQGQLSGVMYTVPAFSEITVDLDIKMMVVTPADVVELSALIRSLLDASHQAIYDEIQHTDISGGASFFGFFSFGASASYSDTKRRMDSWGLSETNQQTIVNAMMKLANTLNDFSYHGTIYNRDHDFSVSGNLFGIVMDCTITQQQSSTQVRVLATLPSVKGADGTSLPTVDPLYPGKV